MSVEGLAPAPADVLIEAFTIATNIGADGSNDAHIIPAAAIEIKEEAQAVVNSATGNGN